MVIRAILFSFTLALLLTGIAAAVLADEGAVNRPDLVRLASACRSGFPADDTIYVMYYAPVAHGASRYPSIVLVHSLADTRDSFSYRFTEELARHLSARGIACGLMTLPFHMQRSVPGESYIGRFAGHDIGADVAALRQSASDVETVAAWMGSMPGADPRKVGAIGISMGAIVVHLAMGQFSGIDAGVALLGGGDLPDLYRRSLPIKLFAGFQPKLLTETAVGQLAAVDPISYCSDNLPRHVLMIEASRDLYVPPENSLALWNALGRPPITWIDTGHFAVFLSESSVEQAAYDYLDAVWNGNGNTNRVPSVSAPTIKIGIIEEWDRHPTAAVRWQLCSLGRRSDQMSLINANIGCTGYGATADVGVTVSQFIDAGAMVNIGSDAVHPYVSLHIAF